VELGKRVPEAYKQFEITLQAYDRWPQTCNGMQPEMAKQLKALERENARLKKMVAEHILGHGDLEGSREGKLVSLERLPTTTPCQKCCPGSWLLAPVRHDGGKPLPSRRPCKRSITEA